MQFLKKMPKLVEISDGADNATKPLSRQTSVQSVKSVNSVITSADVSENQSAVSASTPAESMSRSSSIKRDSMISRSSIGGSGDPEPLIEQNETTELLSEL